MMHYLVYAAITSQCLVSGMDVIVIGAGISGMTAARTIQDNWPATEEMLALTVIESTNHVGGRTYTGTTEMSNWGAMVGAELDFGSSFLQAPSDQQPLKVIADKLFLTGTQTSVSNSVIYSCSEGQRDNCPKLSDDRFDAFMQLLDKAQAKAKANANSTNAEDMSLWDAMENLPGRDDPIMQFHMMKYLEFSTGASPQNLSARHFKDTVDFSGQGIILKTGHGKLPDGMRDGSVKLKINCQEADPTSTPAVEAVPSGVQVPINVVLNQQVVKINELGTDRLEVTMKDGTVRGADHVIMAVPLGVLKQGVIEFDPPLADDKQTAISRLGFTNVVKIGILFSEAFWDVSNDFFGVIQPEGLANAEKMSFFLNGVPSTGRPFLMTYVFGSSADEVEAWDDDKVWATVKGNLEAAFGKKTVAGAQKLQMWRSFWGKDPNYFGAYAAPAPGSLPEDWAAMGKSQSRGRLHFAGEIASTQYPGTVRGAFIAGQVAACEVLKDPVPRPQTVSLLAIAHLTRKWGGHRSAVGLDENTGPELLHGKAVLEDE